MRIQNMSLIVFAASALILGGCESRFVESSPSSVRIDGLPLKERVAEKEKVDSKIDALQQALEKAKTILDFFRKIQKADPTADVYTPIDFLMDVNTELKTKIPEMTESGLVRKGQVTLPIKGMSKSCQTVETLLQSSILYDGEGEDKRQVGERLSYMLKTCGTNGEFVSTVEVDSMGTSLEFRLMNKNVASIFKDLFKTELAAISHCSFDFDSEKIINAAQCSNFDVKLSVSESAKIKNMSFSNTGDIRFAIAADIFENGVFKNNIEVKVDRNGNVQ